MHIIYFGKSLCVLFPFDLQWSYCFGRTLIVYYNIKKNFYSLRALNIFENI